MVDRVGQKASDRAVARVLATVAATPAPAVGRGPTAPTADIAVVSGTAAQLAAKPPVDTERVAQIKRAIANGTFPISPATIADRMLALRYDWIAHDPA